MSQVMTEKNHFHIASNYYRARKTSIFLTALLLWESRLTAGLSHGIDVYKNIENCPPNRTGPKCDLPYQTCPDQSRRCFNNAECVLRDADDPQFVSDPYYCDCSYAEKVSYFAGLECEHSSTTTCKHHDGAGFCTNGGKCGSYIHEGVRLSGCHCLDDFIGPHCQFLRSSSSYGLAGENLYSEYGENFYGFVEDDSILSKGITAAEVGAIAGALIFLLFSMSISLQRRTAELQKRRAERYIDQNDLNATESDTKSKIETESDPKSQECDREIA